MIEDTSAGDEPFDTQRLLDAPEQTLPCGRLIDDILEQVADGRGTDLDAHQVQCPHCQAALTELGSAWRPVHDLAVAPVQVPPGLSEAVVDRINRLVQDVWYTLQLTDLGAVRVAARVIARIARDIAQTVPGVRVALGKSTDGPIAKLVERATGRHRHPHAAVGVLGRTAVIDLAVAVQYDLPVYEVAATVQQRVTRELRESIGLKSVTVNVTVDDVLPHRRRPVS